MESQQNKCIRSITGSIRPTRERALLAAADLPPLAHVAIIIAEQDPVPRLKSKTFEARRRAEPSSSQGPQTADQERPFRGCWRRIACESESARKLEVVPREALGWPLAAWEPANPDVTFSLEAASLCSRTPTAQSRQAGAREDLRALMPADLHTWTDGSVEEAVTTVANGGGGAAVITTQLWSTRLYVAEGVQCSSFQAELAAMAVGLQYCVDLNLETHGSTIRLLSDSLS